MPAAKPKFIEFHGSAYRWTDYDTPTRVRPSTGDGRWHTAGGAVVLYLSVSLAAAWAERVRSEQLQGRREDALEERVDVWEVAIQRGRIADYSTVEKAKAAGFDPEQLVSDDWTACQDEAERLAGLGALGVLAPSAALDLEGELSLTLFGRTRAIEWEEQPAFPSELRCRKVVQDGRPPDWALEHVRAKGKGSTHEASSHRGGISASPH